MKFIIIILIAISLIKCKLEKELKVESRIQQTAITTRDTDLERWREIIYKEPFVLNSKDIPNPFLSPKIEKEMVRTEETIPLELVGIVEKNGKRFALLQDSMKKGYIVKKGDRLGESKIKEIGKNYIIIEEIIREASGKRIIKTKTITLRRE